MREQNTRTGLMHIQQLKTEWKKRALDNNIVNIMSHLMAEKVISGGSLRLILFCALLNSCSLGSGRVCNDLCKRQIKLCFIWQPAVRWLLLLHSHKRAPLNRWWFGNDIFLLQFHRALIDKSVGWLAHVSLLHLHSASVRFFLRGRKVKIFNFFAFNAQKAQIFFLLIVSFALLRNFFTFLLVSAKIEGILYPKTSWRRSARRKNVKEHFTLTWWCRSRGTI